MNGNHATSSAMSVFITEQVTLAVYCYFLLSLYEDQEAIQAPGLLLQKCVNIFTPYKAALFNYNRNFCLPSQVLYFPCHI